ncbi:MAG TPA: ATP-binding protein [Acidimicrobiales bacterium]|jgi:anti-sigma regulatory factor (Ser/Thr protein kinase)
MQDSISLSPHPTGALAARQFVEGTLRRWGRGDLSETAALLSSELVTNVIIHARSEMIVGIDLDDRRLRVTVFDGSNKPPRHSETLPPLEAHGRGLQVVDALATSWGVNEGIRGKSVWFELETTSDSPRTAHQRPDIE